MIAGLCLCAPTTQANDDRTSYSCVQASMIGAGTIKSKTGNTFTIRSDDGNTYQAEVIGSYVVGDYVYHTDPINGWVVILGLAH